MTEELQEQTLERAADRAERMLIERILDGTYPPGTDLPGERILSKEMGIARPALREALQLLNRDGWLEIQQGKSTRVRDYLRDGNLNILIGLLKADPGHLPNFVPDLLDLWCHLAPTYTANAVRRAPGLIIDVLDNFASLDEGPEIYALAMWNLHQALIRYCGNLVYGLIFNGFKDFYYTLATYYYQVPEHRDGVREFCKRLRATALDVDGEAAGRLMDRFLKSTTEFWDSRTIEAYKDAVTEEDEPAEEAEE
jgi:GntR family negative regulator for fad regulon and positive regulator of fabA